MAYVILDSNNTVKYDGLSTLKYGSFISTIYKKIMPSNFLATKYVTSYVPKGFPLKPCVKMKSNKPKGITIHNTGDILNPILNLKSAAEQYILATYNCNMAGAIVHYYVSDKIIWQLLDDNEQGWHSGAGALTKKGNRGVQISGNGDTIAIECVGQSSGAEETTALLVANLCKKYGFDPDLDIYTHQFWSGKYCPAYIIPHWNEFINRVKTMMGIITSSPNTSTTTSANRYVKNSLLFIKSNKFKVVYHDGLKNNYMGSKNYINAGFFGVYDEGITLPAANVCADIDLVKLSNIAQHYLKKLIQNNKLYFSCKDNFSPQFKNKKVSTLIVDANNKISIGEYSEIPTTCKYAISGVPVIRNKIDVSYTNIVLPQGWDNSCLYATSRHFLGIKNNEIWIITGSTITGNYISTSEIYNNIKNENFTDVICLDGGGSYVIAEEGKSIVATSGNRRINTIIEF